MRTPRLVSRLLIPALLAAAVGSYPVVAQAQVVVVPPPPRPWLRARVRWQVNHGFVPGAVYVPPPAVRVGPPVYYAPPQPPVYYAPPQPPVYYAPPPPPVYYAPPPPPVVYQPPPVIYQPPPAAVPPPAPPAAPPPVVVEKRASLPAWPARFGIGATFEGVYSNLGGESTYDGYGIMGQLRYRAARHLSIEIMSGWQHATDSAGLTRTDVPLTGGLLIHVLGPEHALSPYFVLAGGVNFADLQLVDSPTTNIHDSRTQALAQGGGGLELRLGRHFAINGDVRVEGRFNLGEPSAAVANTAYVDGKPVQPIATNVGLRLGVGATVYF